MIKLNNLGYHTDCIARKREGEFIERDSYLVMRMPTNPAYHWGNLILFRNEPKESDYDTWIDVFSYEFGDTLSHVTFGWESQEIGFIDKFVENGFSLESEIVLVLRDLKRFEGARNGLTIRKIVTDRDWAEVRDLQVLVSEGENPSQEYIDFKTRGFETYRSLSESGDGNWWGAFLGDKLVGDMGLYFDDDFETGRYQSVETHPDYRKMGICSELLHKVTSDALSHPNVKLVICTEMNSDAERLYKRLGFEFYQMQHGVSLPRPLENRFGQAEQGPCDT